MATLDGIMDFLADGIGAEETSVSAQVGTGSLYIKKDKLSRTIRGFGFLNSSTNVGTSQVLFTLPEGWRPYKSESIVVVYAASNGLLGLYYGAIGTNGNISQNAGSTLRNIFVSFEFPYTQ